jgi:hypothetical protein
MKQTCVQIYILQDILINFEVVGFFGEKMAKDMHRLTFVKAVQFEYNITYFCNLNIFVIMFHA